MIDFRYHLVSIVAVLLALSAGVVLGSGLLGGPLLDDIQRRADDIRADNDELRQLAEERLERIEQQERFAIAIKPYLLTGALLGTRVVVFETENIDDSLREGVRTAIGDAGGQVAGTIRFTDGFALNEEVKIDELALALGSASSDPDDLRMEAAETLAARVAAASEDSGEQAEARSRLEDLLGDLEGPGFVSLDDAPQGPLIPTDAAFLILAGDPEEPSYDIVPVLTRLSAGLGSRGHAVVLAESGESVWDVAGSVREDAALAEIVATVTAADSPVGAITVVLAIRAAVDGERGHYGLGADPDSIVPSPPPAPTTTPTL